MIKCESGNMSGDGASCGYVTTDCLTVGQFVTEAVAKFSKGEITFQVDDATFTVRGKGNEAFRYECRRFGQQAVLHADSAYGQNAAVPYIHGGRGRNPDIRRRQPYDRQNQGVHGHVRHNRHQDADA